MDSLLNLIPTVMGLGFIDENMHDLLTAMQAEPAAYIFVNLTSIAKTVGCCLALGVGANECYQMILGRRGMDVMKLVHIVIISFCITFSGAIADAARKPGDEMEKMAETVVKGKASDLDNLQKAVADQQKKYLDAVRTRQVQLQEEQTAKNNAERSNSGNPLDYVEDKVEEVVTVMTDKLSYMAMLAEQTFCEYLSIIIRFIGELIFQVMIYGTLIAQRAFMAILKVFAPLMFAMSLSPHFKSAWSQWLSKYLSLSLWGFVAYTCVFYGLFVIQYNLEQDYGSYTNLLTDVSESNLDNLAVIGMQSLGSTCMYVVGCLVGVKLLAMVPEVCSWLIPGGVSSSAGSAVGAMGAAAAGTAMTATTSVAQSAASGAGQIGSQAQKNLNWASYYSR